MKIKTAELRKFKSNSSFIKQNSILPILGYLKFDGGTVTKTNLNSFIIQGIDFKGSFLVDENILMNFLNFTNSETIDISVKENRVIISDGKTKVSSPTDDVNVFPTTSSSVDEKVPVSNEVFCAIRVASNFVDALDLPDIRSHVFVGEKSIAGCNAFIGYVENFKDKLPKMVLSKEVATVIGKFNEADFSENETYVFFETNNCMYGFVKPTYPHADLSRVSQYDSKGKSLIVDKEEVLSFTDMCISSTKTKGLLATMSVKSGKMNLEMKDADFQVDVNKTFDVNGTMEGVFNFNPELMSRMLKNIPETEVSLYPSDKACHVTGDSGFISSIQRLQQLN
jgi:hypothetical protein